jgi:hypothetical protein
LFVVVVVGCCRARKNMKRHKFGQVASKLGGSARNLKTSASGRNLTLAEQMAASEKMRKLKLIGASLVYIYIFI